MRTNIHLDDELVREAMRYSDARSKRALVEEALRTLVEVRSAEERRRTYADRARELRLRLSRLRLREAPQSVLARDRRR